MEQATVDDVDGDVTIQMTFVRLTKFANLKLVKAFKAHGSVQ